jgi:hypothetical protein
MSNYQKNLFNFFIDLIMTLTIIIFILAQACEDLKIDYNQIVSWFNPWN